MDNYHDRGVMKWNGFYLSDHTEKIDNDTKERANINTAKEQMTAEAISEVLNAAMVKNRPVSIQKEERNAEGYYPDDIVGKILGSNELGIYVGKYKVHYDEIRHIEFYQKHKWSHLE